MSTYAAIVALGKRLQGMGWLVGQHPAFGGGHLTGHSPTGYHPKGLAIDVNWPDAGQEAAKIRALLPLLGGDLGGLGRVFKGLPRVALEGPASVALEAGQGALDRVRGAANAAISRAVSATEGVESTGNFSGSWTKVMAQIASSRNWSLADWQRLVQKESGGDPTARNPTSGAFGLGQFLGATAQAYAKYGALSTDPVQQIQAMARYIGDRYGTPSAALAFHNRNNWYSRGGLAGMAAGGLAKKLSRTLKKVRAGGSAKIRGAAVDKLMDRVKDVGLPGGIEKNLKTHADNAAVYGEMADRASMLSFDDASGTPVLGVVGGKDEIGWLEQQLEALFKWRNAMVRAQEIIRERREMISQLLERARDRVKVINDRLRKLGHKPKQNKAAIRTLTHEKGALTKIIGDGSTGLTGKRSSLGTARDSLLENLETVQGLGSPMGVLKSLPSAGVLGGQILQVQTTLRDLKAPRTAITDTETGDDSERSSLLEQLLREANLRTAVSEEQFKVFKDMPQFATGGVVPGVTGAPIPAVVHAGEGVFTQDQMAAMGGGQMITVIVQDGAVDPNKIRVIAGNETRSIIRREARIGSRGLPSRGGGLVG